MNTSDDDPTGLRAARGILIGALLSIPFWLAVGYVVVALW